MMKFPDHECDVIITYENEGSTFTEACLFVSDEFAIVTPIGMEHLPIEVRSAPLDCPPGCALFEDEIGVFILNKNSIKAIEELQTT